MILNIFFSNRIEREQFIKQQFNIEKITEENEISNYRETMAIKKIKFKNRHKNIPGFWLELQFHNNIKGKSLYNDVLNHMEDKAISDNVFYPKINMSLKVLEAKWIDKYNFVNKENHGEIWTLFFQELKSHLKYDRLDIVYKGLLLFLKYNPFFLKKYKRYYMLEDLAYLYEAKGNVGKAIKSLKMQAALQPNSVEPYLNMSSFYIINGMEEEAFYTCKEALKKNPENQYLISNLIISLINIGSYDYAIEFLQKALDKHPDNSYYWKLMGDILYETENNKSAIDCYHRALKIEKSSMIEEFKLDIYTGIADCYYDEENYPEAANYYRKALICNPKEPYLLLSLGQIYFFRLKEIKIAYKYTKLLVDSMPDNGYGQYQLGLIYSQIGNVEKAIWHLYKARSIIPYYRPIQDAINMLKKTNKKLQVY
ncbi:tetratricopeptide repeat protein [Natronincola ferrireducens]|uniref:Tetratricopeptide repeat-containing protein n=1 Tax=Natronincola ferrireducens TaxID=393762 RepID=A0A1G9BC10_9FIRM|nr:tetratricopeptide repeat protein [Natronincola ferrireducens]SDK36989.1 Tetratricopeptide repeat-containing protein [Natronincola ferrireducens]